MLKNLQPYIDLLHNPLIALALFALASALMIWRLSAIEDKGFEGTVVGTLIMPYCSGFANLVFAFVMGRAGNGNGRLVMENCIVNNVTNLTLILGLSALFSAAPDVAGATKKGSAPKAKPTGDASRLGKLDMLFTLIAVFLFTGTLWALGKDRVLDFYDALVLVGLFVFWQILHVFEILKNNVRKNRTFEWSILFDLALIAVAAWGVYQSVDHLVGWVSKPGSQRFFNSSHLGWLSGALMVLPNAFIALYYTYKRRQDIVVSSQVGDGHICIPMCIGLFALFDTMQVPSFFQVGVYLILGAAAVQFACIAFMGRLPRVLGVGLVGAYGFFLYKGLLP